MKKVQVYGVASLLTVGLLVAGWGALSAQAGKDPGKLRTRTGVLQEKEGMHLRIKGTKKQEAVDVLLTRDTRIVLENLALPDALLPEALIRLQGKGKLDQVEVKRVTVLPADETMRFNKKAKSGPAYSSKGQSTEIKVKIKRTQPLQVVNRHQQTIQLVLNENSRLLEQKLTDEKALRAGMKISVKYLEQSKGNQAREVIVHAMEKEKQAKK